ncbi:MAG: hypothetical protein A2W99_03055 [Bacteroidetes bacterium GWF2_33_16]|nr:MAG: hypothetical protein A2X00_09960 [Bacteroidetes bacterium GWE2_32_14]OFY07873.1 MAG: hypothetical protein A2W99_03055 [Bacteroidetes bacterium GWF2_33_16]
MKDSIILGLIQNIAILLSFSMLYDHIWIRYEEKRSIYLKIFIGIFIGFIGLILMLTPWVLAPGMVFDTRSILLSATGLFFGSVPTVIAMVITGAYRIYLGGDGVFMGVAVIISSGVIGIVWRKLRPDFRQKKNIYELLAMGYVVHLVMLSCTLLLPFEKIWPTIKIIIFPLLLIYPFGTMLLGFLLFNRDRNWENKKLLKESEERFRSMFESNHAIMMIVDPENGKILDANPAASEFYGYTHYQFINDLFISNISVSSEEEIKEVMKQALVDKKGSFIFKHRLANGNIRNVEINTGSTIIDGKNVLFSIVHDITNRIKAEEKSANLNKIIQESVNEIYIFSAENFKFIEVNNEALRNIGYSLDELKKMTPLDIKPYLTEVQLNELIDPLNKAEKNKIYFETIHRRKNGTEYPAEVHLQKVNYGNIPVFVAIILDITERKKTEKTLSESEERLRLAISSTKQGFFDLNMKTGEAIVNDDYILMLGYDPSVFQETHKNWLSRLHPDDVENTQQKYNDYITGKIPEYKVEFRQKTKQGKWKWIMSTGKIFETDNNGKPIRMLGIHTDIDEMKSVQIELQNNRENLEKLVKDRTVELNEQASKLKESQSALLFLLEDINESREELQVVNSKLEEANKELEAFTYTVSHDLKAPLRAIDGFSNFLLEDYKDKLDEEGLRLINIICENTKKMDHLIVDLLQLSKVNRNEMHFSNIDMNIFANQIYTEIASPELINKFKFKVNDIPTAYADQILLKQVWINLISNAIKFTRTKDICSIEIDGKIENEFVIYSIKDSGVGYDIRYESKLFGVFQRLHKADEYEGTGVGLSIVKRIINRHGGKVWAESELGKGSTFYFSLPVKEEKL